MPYASLFEKVVCAGVSARRVFVCLFLWVDLIKPAHCLLTDIFHAISHRRVSVCLYDCFAIHEQTICLVCLSQVIPAVAVLCTLEGAVRQRSACACQTHVRTVACVNPSETPSSAAAREDTPVQRQFTNISTFQECFKF